MPVFATSRVCMPKSLAGKYVFLSKRCAPVHLGVDSALRQSPQTEAALRYAGDMSFAARRRSATRPAGPTVSAIDQLSTQAETANARRCMRCRRICGRTATPGVPRRGWRIPPPSPGHKPRSSVFDPPLDHSGDSRRVFSTTAGTVRPEHPARSAGPMSSTCSSPPARRARLGTHRREKYGRCSNYQLSLLHHRPHLLSPERLTVRVFARLDRGRDIWFLFANSRLPKQYKLLVRPRP